MKNLKYYNLNSEYEAEKSTHEYPTVSYIEESKTVEYKLNTQPVEIPKNMNLWFDTNNIKKWTPYQVAIPNLFNELKGSQPSTEPDEEGNYNIVDLGYTFTFDDVTYTAETAHYYEDTIYFYWDEMMARISITSHEGNNYIQYEYGD